jgi:ribosomal protein S18 acetylase RimI-like enzyme
MVMGASEPSRELNRLENIAFRAWPAATIELHRGMRLRFTGGESRRANSAAVYACDRELPLSEIIETGEAFYSSRGRRPCFQIGPTAPEGLDAALASRGYEIEGAVWVQTAALDPRAGSAVAVARRVPVQTRVTEEPDDGWIHIEITRGRFADIGSTFLDALATLGSRAGYATAHVDGTAVAACLYVCDEDVVVLAAMKTLPEARRLGAARALVYTGVEWALQRGAVTGYLQVECENAAALALYAAHGFATAYGYHYRTGPVR